MAVLEVAGLVKRYGERTALDGVSLSVRQGECYALLGPNGAGKSTLIRILTTLVSPDEGSVVVEGADVLANPMGARRAVGVAFQDALLDKHLTAREALDHHARLYGVPREQRKQRIARLARGLAFTERLDERTTRLSGGLRRRVDLARALMTEPKLLVLDEPTAGLDLASRRRLGERIRRLAEAGIAVLLATHDMEEAEIVADRVGILHEGRLIAEGTPSELKASLGWKVVRIETTEASTVGELLAAHAALGEVAPVRGGLEVSVPETSASAAQVLDLLDGAGIAYTRVTVREPTLGDLFLRLTGKELRDEPRPAAPEGDDEAHAAMDAALELGPELREGHP